jgi:hypothetical protein
MAALCEPPFLETEPENERRRDFGQCEQPPPRHRCERKKVQLYRFALRRDDGSNALESALFLVDLAAAWSKVVEIAHDARATEGRIFVTDKDEDVVIMIGVASARAMLGAAKKKLNQPSNPSLRIAV